MIVNKMAVVAATSAAMGYGAGFLTPPSVDTVKRIPNVLLPTGMCLIFGYSVYDLTQDCIQSWKHPRKMEDACKSTAKLVLWTPVYLYMTYFIFTKTYISIKT